MASHQAKPSIANASSLFGDSAQDDDQTEDPFAIGSDPDASNLNPTAPDFTPSSTVEPDAHPQPTAPSQQLQPPTIDPATSSSIESAVPSPTALFGDSTDGNDDWLGGGEQVNPVESVMKHPTEEASSSSAYSTTQEDWSNQQYGYQQPAGESNYEYPDGAYNQVEGVDGAAGAMSMGVGVHEGYAYDPSQQQQQQYDHGYFDESGNWIYYQTQDDTAGYDPNQYGYDQSQQPVGYEQGYDPNLQYQQNQNQYDPNIHDPNQQYDPNQTYDPNQVYDPNQQNYQTDPYSSQEQSTYDPSQYPQQQYEGTVAGNQYDSSQSHYDPASQQQQPYDPYAPQPSIENHDSNSYSQQLIPILQTPSNDIYSSEPTSTSIQPPPPPRGSSPYDPFPSQSLETPSSSFVDTNARSYSATPPPPPTSTNNSSTNPPKGPPRVSSKKTSLGVYEIPKDVGTPTPESSSTFQKNGILEIVHDNTENQLKENNLSWEMEEEEEEKKEEEEDSNNKKVENENQDWIQELEEKVSFDDDNNHEPEENSTNVQSNETPQIKIGEEEGFENQEVVEEIKESNDNTPTPGKNQEVEKDSLIEDASKGLESLNLGEGKVQESEEEGIEDQTLIPKAPSPFNEDGNQLVESVELGFQDPEGGTLFSGEEVESGTQTQAQENAAFEYGAYQNQEDYGYGYDYGNQNQGEAGEIEGEAQHQSQFQGDEGVGYPAEVEGAEHGAYSTSETYGNYNENYNSTNQENNPSNDLQSNPYAATESDSSYNPYGPVNPIHSNSSSSTDTEHAIQSGLGNSGQVYDPYAPQGNEYGSENQHQPQSIEGEGSYQPGYGEGEFEATNYENVNQEVYNPYGVPNQDSSSTMPYFSQLNVSAPPPKAPSTPLNQQGVYSGQFSNGGHASSSPYDPSSNLRKPPHSANDFSSNSFNQQRDLNDPYSNNDKNSNDYGNIPKSAPASGSYEYGFPSDSNTPGTINGSDNSMGIGGSYFQNQPQQQQAPISPYAPSNPSNYGPRSDYGGNSLPSHSRTTSAIGATGHHDVLEEKRSNKIPIISFGIDGKILIYSPNFNPNDENNPNGMGMGMLTNSRSEFPTKISFRNLKNVIPMSCYFSVFEPNSLNGPLFEGSNSSSTSAFSKATGGGNNSISTSNKNKKSNLIKLLDEKIVEMKKGLGYLKRRGSSANINLNGSGDGSSFDEDLVESNRKISKEEDKNLLLRILKIILENDGNTLNNSKFDQDVKNCLIEDSKDLSELSSPESKSFISPFSNSGNLINNYSDQTQKKEIIKTYQLKTSFLDEITKLLLNGSRKEAVNLAIEHKMWSHALTIASSVDKDCWRDVVNQFTNDEILGIGNDDLNGNFSEERLGLKVVYDLITGQQPNEAYSIFRPKSSTPSAPGLPSSSTLTTHALLSNGEINSPTSASASSSQPKWRQAAAMVVANRNAGDSASLTAIGDGLLEGNWHEAAHICYLLSPLTSPFGGIDTPSVRLTLLGSKSPRASSEYLKDLDSLALTEIYEFSHCLTPTGKGLEPFNGIPHLQAYRLAHAYLLAEMGETQKAQKYCEAIAATLKSGKPSPYFHRTLVSQLKLFSERLTGAPTHSEGGSSNWMTRKMQRPTLDGMWGALEGRFTKFIAGEDSDGSNGPKTATPNNKKTSFNGKLDTIGPFSHYSSITPDATSGGVSRVQSYADFNNGNQFGGVGSGFSGMNSPPMQPSSRAGSAMDFHRDTRTSSPANNYRATSAMGYRAGGGNSNSNPISNSLRDPFNEWPSSNQNSSLTFNPYQQQQSSDSQTNLDNSERSSESGGAYDGPYKSQGPTNNAPWYNPSDQAGSSNQWGSSYEPTNDSSNGRVSQDSSSQPLQGSGNEPYYGYQSHGAEEEKFASNLDSDGQVGGNFSSPMDAFSANTPQPNFNNSYSNQDRNQADDEDDDDLGFGNSSSRKKNQDNSGNQTNDSNKSKVEEKKEEVKKPELKSSSSSTSAGGGSWLGRFWGRKESSGGMDEGNKAKKAHLGEETSFYYDKETKRWVNKKAGGDSSAAPSPPPPPPRAQTTSPSMQGRPGMLAMNSLTTSSSNLGGPPAPPSGLRRGSAEGLAPPRGTPPISESNDEEGGGWGSSPGLGAGPPPARARSNLAEDGQMAAVQPPFSRSTSASLPPSGQNSAMGTPPPPPNARGGGTLGKKKPIKNRYVVVD